MVVWIYLFLYLYLFVFNGCFLDVLRMAGWQDDEASRAVRGLGDGRWLGNPNAAFFWVSGGSFSL